MGEPGVDGDISSFQPPGAMIFLPDIQAPYISGPVEAVPSTPQHNPFET